MLPTQKKGSASLRIASKRATEEEAEHAVDEMLEKVKERVGHYIYSCDDEELAQVVAGRLMEQGLTLSKRGILYRRYVCVDNDGYSGNLTVF